MNAIATPKSAPDAGLGAFTKEFRSRTGSRRVGELDRFSAFGPPQLRIAYKVPSSGPPCAQPIF